MLFPTRPYSKEPSSSAFQSACACTCLSKRSNVQRRGGEGAVQQTAFAERSAANEKTQSLPVLQANTDPFSAFAYFFGSFKKHCVEHCSWTRT